jgi:hypothetical protein
MAKKFRARISFFVAQRYSTSTEKRESKAKAAKQKARQGMAH